MLYFAPVKLAYYKVLLIAVSFERWTGCSLFRSWGWNSLPGLNRTAKNPFCPAAKITKNVRKVVKRTTSQGLLLVFIIFQFWITLCNFLMSTWNQKYSEAICFVVICCTILEKFCFQRRTGCNRRGIEGEDERQIIERQLKNLDREIQLRGSELCDIQKKCTKAYSDEQREQLWNAVRNLTEARAGLDRLFDAVIKLPTLF